MPITNFEHLRNLSVRSAASVLWNLSRDSCAYCPKNRLRDCKDNCRDGFYQWLMQPYIPSSDVWKGR